MRLGIPIALLISVVLLALLGWYLVTEFPTYTDVEDIIVELSDRNPKTRELAIYKLLDDRENAKPAAPKLIELTRDEVVRVRIAAVDVLPYFVSEEGVRDAIISAADDLHPRVRVAALNSLYSLGAGGDVIRILTDKVSDRDKLVRRTAIQRLGDLSQGSSTAIPELIKILEWGDPDIKILTVVALGKIGADESSVDAIIALLDDADPQIRLAAVNTLSSFRSDARKAVPSLLKMLPVSDDLLKAQLLIALGAIGKGPEVTSALLAHLTNPVQSLANAAYEAIAELGPEPVAMAELLKQLSSDQVWHRTRAAYTISKFGPDVIDELPSLLEHLDDESPEVRKALLFAVSRIGEKEQVLPYAWEMLADPSPMVRGQAAMVLAQIGEDAAEVIPDLLLLLDDNPAVSLKSALAINAIDPSHLRQTLPIIERHINSDRYELKALALKGLGDIGPAAKVVLPRLENIILHAPIHRRWKNFSSIPLGMIGSPQGMPRKRVYVAAAYAVLRISPGNDPALFLIAQCLGDEFVEIRQYALQTLRDVEWEYKKIEPALRYRLDMEPNDELRQEIWDLLKRGEDNQDN